jgi:S1-C subfamily serine protease
VLLYGAFNPGPPVLRPGDVASQIADALASQPPAPPLAAAAYAAVQSSIVTVEAENSAASPAPTGELGSGVIVNAAGQVLTAFHVVAGATAIRLTFADGSTSPATLASSDPATDIAVLQPDVVPASAVPATLGNPGAIQIGNDAYVAGNPFGLTGSLSSGVISGLDRSFRDPTTDRIFSGLIQIDAAVNPGNSGGPLLDREGRVIGIITALVNPTGERVFVGVGLAVPIDVAGRPAGLPRV